MNKEALSLVREGIKFMGCDKKGKPCKQNQEPRQLFSMTKTQLELTDGDERKRYNTDKAKFITLCSPIKNSF